MYAGYFVMDNDVTQKLTDRENSYPSENKNEFPSCDSVAIVPLEAGKLLMEAGANAKTVEGDDFKMECPTGSGYRLTLFDIASEISQRLSTIFLRDETGRRPVYGGTKKFQQDPYWKDYILFYEYFHGDNGAGLGASHQTGWTGVIARTFDLFARVTPEKALNVSKDDLMARMTREQVVGR